MFVLLPPSEGKAIGGAGAPLDLAGLSFPALHPVRERLVHRLEALARREPELLGAALRAGPAHVGLDAVLTTAPALPAVRRYTGVVYDTLDHASLTGGARRRANTSLLIASALFGLLRPGDRIPAYRLSAGTSLPGVGSLRALWRPFLEAELGALPGLVVDLRSGAYAALAPLPSAVQVRVLRDTDGVRRPVSHDSKWTKGALARVLCVQGARSVRDVAVAARTVCDAVEVEGRRVDLVLTGLASARTPRGES